MFFVQNTTKGMISIPLEGEERNLQLKPGVNPVPDKQWEKAKKLYMIGVNLELGLINDDNHTEDSKEPLKKDEKKPHVLEGLTPKKRREVIRDTADDNQLIAWLEDAPKDIEKLIQDQLKKNKKA